MNVVRNPGDYANPASTTTDPNPVFAELQPAGPPPKVHTTPKTKKPKTTAPDTGRLAIPGSERPTTDPLTSRSAAFTFADCGVIPSCLDCEKISAQRHLRPQGLLA